MSAYALQTQADSKSGGNQANNRDVRNLANLGETASTSRVLNLSQVYLQSGDQQALDLSMDFN